MPGRQVRRYGVLLHRGDWREAEVYRRADEFLLPLETAPVGRTSGGRPPWGRAIAVDGVEVSAVRREAGGLLVRIFNPSPAPATARVAGPGGSGSGCVVDLAGSPLRPFSGEVGLGPWEIATLRLDEGGVA